MKQNIIHIGLDVDDTQYHRSALNKSTGVVLDFKCQPTLKRLMSQLSKLHMVFPGNAFRICYKASYIGFTLQRDIADKGVHCDVVAPTSIPNPRGRQIKTDHIDPAQLAQLAQLAQFYANDLVTFVTVPDTDSFLTGVHWKRGYTSHVLPYVL